LDGDGGLIVQAMDMTPCGRCETDRDAAEARSFRPGSPEARRADAIEVLGRLRQLERGNGIENSRIALDVVLVLYESAGRGLAVREVAAVTGHSGPTVRLVLSRLISAGMVQVAEPQGKIVLYQLSEGGVRNMDLYMQTLAGLK
jgi:DNA-binding transcriptional ArsR family regulator